MEQPAKTAGGPSVVDVSATVAAFLDAAAAKRPVPGGGAVAALVGALAASMGEMTLNYSVGKKGLEASQAELVPALAELGRARALLARLVTEDQEAYLELTAARKLPEGSAERAARYPAAFSAAIGVPESIAAVGVAVLEVASRVANFANVYLLSDLAVSADLAMAAVRCAVHNVRVNLRDVTDEAERRRIESEINRMLDRATALNAALVPRIWARIDRGA